MKLEHQVTSLELSKRLQELGVKQESYFNWNTKSEAVFTKNDGRPFVAEHTIAAFTVAELISMLPRQICDKDQTLSGMKGKCYSLVAEFLGDDYSSNNKINGFRLRYGDTKVKVDSESKLNSAGIYYVGTEADARAKMLIYLLENKFINKEE